MLRPHWNNVEKMSYQRWNNVLQCWKTVASVLCKVDLCCFSVGHQHCINIVQHWKSNFGFCFIFNVVSMLMVINSFKKKLIQCENVGWLVSMKRLILKNILPATLLTKWNLWAFFKDYAKTFTTPILTNFFRWLLLIIHLRLVVLNRTSLTQVPS